MHYPKGKPLEDTDSTETWVQERPTRTRINPLRTTKLPFGQRIMINDHQFCEKIRGTKPRYLQAKVYDGNPKFDGYWLQDPYCKSTHLSPNPPHVTSPIPVTNAPTLAYNGYKAQLCDSKSDAAPMAFNAESKVITTWRDRPGCAFIGLRLYAGNLHEMHSDTWLGEAGFGNGTAEYATGHMDITPQKEFVWQHEYFEHWLVCDHFEGVPVLKYKSNYHPWDYDRRRCGRVKLFWME